jgi:hypothetical protein
MAKYNEDAILIANVIRDKNALKTSIASSTDIIQQSKTSTGNVSFEVCLVKVTTPAIGTAFTVAHPVNGEINAGFPVGIGSKGAITVVLQREYEWDTQTRLDEGTYDANINISNGDIRLG